MEAGISCFTIFGKEQVGRGNVQSLDQNTNYSIINEIWVTQHPCCF